MRSHLVPHFYLKYFADPSSEGLQPRTPYLWIWDHKERQWQKRSPKNAAVKSGYYELFPEEKGTGGELERILQTIEDNASRILREVVFNRLAISDQQRHELALFILTLGARQPRHHELTQEHMNEAGMEFMKDHLTRLASDRNYLAQYNVTAGEGSSVTPEAAQDLLDHLSEFRIEAPRQATIFGPIYASFHTAHILANMCWYILWAPHGQHYVTSDNPPKSFIPRYAAFAWPAALGNPEVEVTCPLSRDYALVAIPKPNRWLAYGPANERAVEAINIRTMFLTSRRIFCPSKEFPGVAVMLRVVKTAEEGDAMMADINRRTLLPHLPKLDE